MPFTVNDVRDLVQLLEQHPEWRAELRRLVLTDELLTLPELVRELAEGQRQFQVDLSALAQAQARTEERLGRVEEALAQLAAAQARTEQGLERLQRQVGGLSETVGGDIEDIAYIVLHDVLHREFGWSVGVLERSWQSWNGEAQEIDVFGRATDPARPDVPIWIVGEAKHNLTVSEVQRAARQAQQARQHLAGEVFAVCFCYRARPEVLEAIREAGLRLVFSYGKLA